MMTVTGDSVDITTYFALRLAADGTDATGLTITNFDLQYVRSGAAPSTKADATALAAVDSAHGDNQAIEVDATDQPGLYRVDWPDAAFASGVKEVILTVKVATAFTEHLRVMIDAPVNTTKVSGTAQTANDNGADINEILTDTGTTLQAELDAIQAAVITNAAGADIAADIIAIKAETAAILADTGTDGVVVASIATGAITAAAIANGAIDAATFAADVDAEILSYLVDDATRIDASALNTASGAIGSNGSGLTEAGGTGDQLTAIPWNASWDAEVQSEVDDALVAQRLDELLNADSDIDGAAPPTVGSVFHELMSKTAGSFTFDQTTDSLEAIRDRGDAAWITATSVTVSDKTGFSLASTGLDLVTTWTVAITGNMTGNLSGSVGSVTGAVGSVTGNVGGSIGSLAAQAKADVNAEVDSAIETYHLDHLLAATYDPAAKPGAADALLNELVESDAGVSRFTANSLEQAPSGGLDAAGVRAAVGLTSANLDTQLGDIPTVAEFEARTLVAASYFDPAADTVANVTTVGSVTGNVGGSIGSLATQAKADVNAEVVDVMATDTHAEQGQGNPPATTTYAVMIGYVYKSWRNKKDNDGSTTQLYADDGTTVDQKQTTSESGGTVTKGEWVTGP